MDPLANCFVAQVTEGVTIVDVTGDATQTHNFTTLDQLDTFLIAPGAHGYSSRYM